MARILAHDWNYSISDTFPLDTSSHGQTLGLEIEVPWSAYFPKEYAEWFDGGKRHYSDFSPEEKETFDTLCQELDRTMLPHLEAVSEEL